MATSPRSPRKAPRTASKPADEPEVGELAEGLHAVAEAGKEAAADLQKVADAARAVRRETTDARMVRGFPINWFVGGPAGRETR